MSREELKVSQSESDNYYNKLKINKQIDSHAEQAGIKSCMYISEIL